MRPPESITLVYFGYVAASAIIGRSLRNRRRALVVSTLVIIGVVALGQAHTVAIDRVRDWIPGLYAVLGYWTAGMLAGSPLLQFEAWLERIDTAILPSLNRFVTRAPRGVLEYLESAYLCCYPLVPCAFAWLALNGHVASADRYWTVVLLALYPCYGPVAWLPTRPPRAIESVVALDARRLSVRPLNARVLRDVSIQLNTFPSGHTAGALAAAAVVATMMPVSGAVVGAIAISIAIASVVGRYHYAADAISGAAVAVFAFGVGSWWLGGS